MRPLVIFCMLVAMGSCFHANAQTAASDMKPFEWDSYNVAFEIPSYMELKTNNAELFYASGGDMFINIYPEKTSTSGATLCDEHYAELRLSDKSLVSDVTEYDTEQKSGLEGTYVIGSGYNGSSKYAFIVAGLNDVARENGMKVDIQILTTSSNYSNLIEDAVAILNSFDAINNSGNSSGSGSNYTSTSGSRDGKVEWNDYNFTFEYPTTLDVKYESSSFFSADDGTLHLEVRRNRGTMNPKSLSQEVLQDMGITGPNDTANDEFDQGGLDGWKIIGSGSKDGTSVVYCVLAFEDKRSNSNYEVEMILYMRSGTDSDLYVDYMREIIESVSKINY